MKKIIKKVLVFGLLLMSTITFAFPADPDPSVDPPAPIDNYILVLTILGIGFAFWINAKKSEKVQKG